MIYKAQIFICTETWYKGSLDFAILFFKCFHFSLSETIKGFDSQMAKKGKSHNTSFHPNERIITQSSLLSLLGSLSPQFV